MSILNQTVCCLGYNFLCPDGSSAFPVDLNCTIQIHRKQIGGQDDEWTVIALGLGIERPRRIVGQFLDTSVNPHQLKIRIKADRGAEFPCPVCGRMCKTHDFQEKQWRHLNFFQHHCYIMSPCFQDKVSGPWGKDGESSVGKEGHQVHHSAEGIGIDETSSGKGHRYVTVFIDLDRKERPVLFVTERALS